MQDSLRASRQWLCAAIAGAVVLGLAPPAAAQIGPGPFAAFPTADPTDARFLGFGCPGLATFESDVSVGIEVPIDEASFTVSIFDGDTGGVDTQNRRHWDLGNRQLVYRLYADPLGEATTDPGALVGTWFGNAVNPTSGPGWTASTAQMPDNDWWGLTIGTLPAALSPSGNFTYHLHVTADGTCLPGEQLESNLKIAASSPLSFLIPRFALTGGMRQVPNDAPIVYPNGFPSPDGFIVDDPTTYDGTFTFGMALAAGTTELRIFDGDFDHGTRGVLLSSPFLLPMVPCVDTDDLDTPDYADFPFQVGAAARPQGAWLDPAPPDDNSLDLFRRGEPGDPHRMGCIRYEVISPSGQVFRNDNPSAGEEWEQFRIASALADDPGMSDHQVATDHLEAGVWTVRIVGQDLANLNFLFLDAGACSNVDGEAVCTAGTVFLVGDTVWLDLDGDGTQDPGESGIPGVALELRDAEGNVLDTTVTGDPSSPSWTNCVAHNTGLDELGLYCFGLADPGDYTVVVAPSNFAAGGPLFGMTSTTGGESQSDTVVDDNVLTYDFGYQPPACGPCEGKVSSLTFQYQGDGAALIEVFGRRGPRKNDPLFEGFVAPGGVFTVDGPDTGNPGFRGTLGTEIDVFVGGVHHADIHTSCSQPIGPGMVFGDFLILAGDSKHGGPLCPADGEDPPGEDPPGEDPPGEDPPANPGTGTIGYWKNHDWPVSSIELGGVVYSEDAARDLLRSPVRGDMSVALAQQLIAAKLNVTIGNDASCVAATIAAADAWLAEHPPGSNPKRGAKSEGEDLKDVLDAYNNGRLCAPHRG